VRRKGAGHGCRDTLAGFKLVERIAGNYSCLDVASFYCAHPALQVIRNRGPFIGRNDTGNTRDVFGELFAWISGSRGHLQQQRDS
jgi:hypothetical protein